MSRDAEDDDHTTFLSIARSEGEGEVVLSRAAFQLHSFGMMNSIRFGTPGFVTDDYLNSISAETSITAQELCSAGMWRRFDGTDLDGDPVGGYVVMDRETVEMSLDAHDQVRSLPPDDEEAG